mmetsp:Transcript_11292/g.23139  ORF Transcript_11292/g.23139 Transcript_11292/m.23139 type:complete len:183 (-) Transcript_11292:366-914(-)
MHVETRQESGTTPPPPPISSSRSTRASRGRASTMTRAATTPHKSPKASSMSTLSVTTTNSNHTSIPAPYLKGGKSHFEKKVERAIQQMDSQPKSPSPAKKSATIIKSRKTSLQQNTKWRNKLSTNQCCTALHKEAYKEATTEAAAIKLEETPVPWKAISNIYNKKYSLECDGRGQGSRSRSL